MRQVPIYYVDEVICNGDVVLGCYFTNPDDDYIEIKKGKAYQWASQGCTIRDHEIIHAWGYVTESEVAKVANCSNPNDLSNLYGLYEADNIKHWNPNYVWSGYH